MPSWMPDGRSDRARIGVITPHLDPVPETEFQVLAPRGVTVHAARATLGMVGPDGEIIPRVGPETAREFASSPELDNAVRRIAAVAPRVIVYAFTSSSYILGATEDEALQARLERASKGIPIIIQTPAIAAALRAIEAGRIALFHPPWFTEDLDALGARYFRAAGFDVLHHGPAQLRNTYGDITPEQVHGWISERIPSGTEAVVIGGGGFRATGAIAALERDLNLAVLSANQAAFWMAMRIAGLGDDIKAYGRLFSRPLPVPQA